MLSLAKLPYNHYAWYHNDKCMFIGHYTEVLAYGYWTFGLAKSEVYKALDSLHKAGEKIFI